MRVPAFVFGDWHLLLPAVVGAVIGGGLWYVLLRWLGLMP